jgi:hypothetical protein
MPTPNEPEHGFDGEHARDTHRGGLGDNYARDGGWSGGGRADDVVREEPADPDQDDEHSIGKGRE